MHDPDAALAAKVGADADLNLALKATGVGRAALVDLFIVRTAFANVRDRENLLSKLIDDGLSEGLNLWWLI